MILTYYSELFLRVATRNRSGSELRGYFHKHSWRDDCEFTAQI